MTEITALDAFYPAEDYHQNYYKKSSIRYRFYVSACGRYARLDLLIYPEEELSKLSPMALLPFLSLRIDFPSDAKEPSPPTWRSRGTEPR